MRLVFLLCVMAACGDASAREPQLELDPHPAEATPASRVNPRLLRRFKPLQRTQDTDDAVELGKQLFFDPRLSSDGTVSCSSCHVLSQGGVDGKAVSVGVGGRRGRRNSPTVYNAVRQTSQFWDGRAPDLIAQARGPLLAHEEMAMGQPAQVTRVLRDIPGYAPRFASAFPDHPYAVDFEHAVEAIAAFETTLITPSRWDRFLDGDATALTFEEIEGLRVFGDLGCVQCHTGELVGGRMYQTVGAAVPWPNQRDQGRFEITNQPADRMLFKVPSLRNVRLTAPYFHDGSVADLGEAIRMMGLHQLGLEMNDREVAAITTWLDTLTGDPASRDIPPPALPD
jgi:cytochrome c peroxidase